MCMKILLIDNSSLTPVNDSLCCEPKTGGFSSELKSLGHQVTMYGQIIEDKNNIHSFDILKNDICVVGYKRKKNKFINYIFLYLMIIPQIIKNDFIYIFYPNSFKYISILCWILNKPYGLYIRGENDLCSKESKYIYKKSKVIFTVTDYFSKIIKKISSKEMIFSIKPMIDLNQNDIFFDREYRVEGKFKILFLARIEKDKGIEEFLYAISDLINRKKYKIEVDVVGSGGFLENAKAIAKELNILDVVDFKGAIFDKNIIREMYIQSNLYVLPTYHEGFPRTLYEAMIFGTPIITTFVGGIPGIMEDGFNCLKIEPKSVSSIVNALEYSFENYPDMQNHAKNGMETVRLIVDSSRLSHASHLSSVLNNEYDFSTY